MVLLLLLMFLSRLFIFILFFKLWMKLWNLDVNNKFTVRWFKKLKIDLKALWWFGKLKKRIFMKTLNFGKNGNLEKPTILTYCTSNIFPWKTSISFFKKQYCINYNVLHNWVWVFKLMIFFIRYLKPIF